jgi:RNA polymerase sigma factor (sigma-70 family)
MNEVVAIKNSSEAAFVRVYQQLHVKMFRFFLRRVKDEPLANELTQQVYIKLWRSRLSLSESHPIEAQLMTMAGSILVDHLRQHARTRRVQRTFTDTVYQRASVEDVFSVSAFEKSDYLNAVIEQLPPVRKKIIRLRVIDGLSNKEIAGLLDISSKTVEDHITKAVKYVRSIGNTLMVLMPLLTLQVELFPPC